MQNSFGFRMAHLQFIARFLLALGSLFLAASVAVAQVGTASISGSVTDSTGAVIAGATVSVRNVQTGVELTFHTDSSGRYSAPSLMIGQYEVQAQTEGFQTAIRKDITLTVGRDLALDFQLVVGKVGEHVTVAEEAIGIDTVTSNVGSLVGGREMRELPLNGRNFQQLILLTSGVQEVALSNAEGSSFSGRSKVFSVSGARPEGQAMLLDGARIQGFWNTGAGSSITGTSLGVEAIAEFQTLTNTYSAEFGGNGAVINAVTRSGSNSLHGSLYEYYRSSSMDARNYFDPLSGPAQFHRSQFGAAVGGPIRKNRTFFFGNYEGLREVLGRTFVSLVPDQNAHNGFLPCSAAPTVPCNNATGLANVGVNPAIAPIMALYPLPNSTSVGGGVARYSFTAGRPSNEDFVTGRVDHVISSTDNLFVRYSFDNAVLVEPSANPGFPEASRSRNQYVTIGETKIVSSSLVNIARFSFVRTRQGAVSVTTGADVPELAWLGKDRPAGGLSVTGLAGFGYYGDGNNFVQNEFIFSDEIDWTHGKHNLKIGGEINRLQSSARFRLFYSGSYTFNGLADFLQGRPFYFAGPTPTDNDGLRNFREIHIVPYIEDNYRVTPRLTLNLGLRYEYMTNPVEANGKMFAIPNPLTDPAPVHVDHAFATNPAVRNFDPRIGFAWQPGISQKTSVRGGFGMFHDPIMARNYGWQFVLTKPYVYGFAFFPSFPDPGAAVAALKPTLCCATFYGTDTTPYMMQYNLNVQRELWPNAVLNVGYVGSRGVNLLVIRDWNVVIPTSVNGQPFRASPTGPFPNPKFGSIQSSLPDGSSNYNSLQTSLKVQLGKAAQFQVSHTWSKCIDNGSGSITPEGVGTGQNVQTDPFDINRDRGPCSFDIRHNFFATTVLSLPFRGNRLVEGWQLSLIGRAVSGFHFSTFTSGDRANFGYTTSGTSTRPDLRPGFSSNPIIGRPDKWYDPAAFALQPAGFFGNAPRNSLVGPGLLNFDVAATKDTRFRESLALQFRADIFNIFNHANFGLPNVTVMSASGVPNPTAGVITNTATPSRQIQLALKIIF